MKLIEYFKALFFIIIGSILMNISYWIRFRNPVLREELMLFMQKGENNYFLVFALFDSLNIFLLIMVFIYVYRKDIKSYFSKRRKDRLNKSVVKKYG